MSLDDLSALENARLAVELDALVPAFCALCGHPCQDDVCGLCLHGAEGTPFAVKEHRSDSGSPSQWSQFGEKGAVERGGRRNGLSDSDSRESQSPSHRLSGVTACDSGSESNPESVESVPEFVDPTVTLPVFVANVDESAAEPLIGCKQGALLTPGGLMFLVAKTGGGKTTNAVDLILHTAAGVDYSPFTFPRPLKIMVVQNEGPREAFRQKLEARLEHWPHPHEAIRVWDDPAAWGSVQVASAAVRDRMRQVLAAHDTDLVLSDSLTRFGMRGNGTPEETREFVTSLNEVGLGRDRAFLLLHHPLTRPDASLDELDQWRAHGGHTRTRSCS